MTNHSMPHTSPNATHQPPAAQGRPRTAVNLPNLTSRSAIAWCVATAAALFIMIVYLSITQPQNRWIGAVMLTLEALAVVLVVSERRWFDPTLATVGRTRLWFLHRSAPLEVTTNVQFLSNGAGALGVTVRPRQGRPINVAVLLLSDYVEKSMPTDTLRMLADTIERSRASGGRLVAAGLRAQADHVASGGTARTSPLAASVTYGAINTAKAGAAGGAVGHL